MGINGSAPGGANTLLNASQGKFLQLFPARRNCNTRTTVSVNPPVKQAVK